MGALSGFERDLARMLHDGEGTARYEDRHRDRLHAAVRARRRARTAWTATGSALTVACLGVALLFLGNALARGGAPSPSPRPVTSASSATQRERASAPGGAASSPTTKSTTTATTTAKTKTTTTATATATESSPDAESTAAVPRTLKDASWRG